MEADFSQLWQPVALGGCGWRHWQVGPVCFWLRRDGDEVLVTHDRVDGAEEAYACAVESAPPPDLAVSRVMAPSASAGSVRLAPALPRRPVVVRPDSDVHLATGAEAALYALIPLRIRVCFGAVDTLGVAEVASVCLSDTWFGEDSMSGELCYAMRTAARRSMEHCAPRAHRAVCPVTVRNGAEAGVAFARVCVRCPHLGLYWFEGRLWTTTVTVSYRGEEDAGTVAYSNDRFGGDKPLAAPAAPSGRSLVLGSLARLTPFIGMR